MTRCPKCNNALNLKVLGTDYNEDGWEIEVVRHYKCKCGAYFKGRSYFHAQEKYEITDIETLSL